VEQQHKKRAFMFIDGKDEEKKESCNLINKTHPAKEKKADERIKNW
jgi:hypothetical protein